MANLQVNIQILQKIKAEKDISQDLKALFDQYPNIYRKAPTHLNNVKEVAAYVLLESLKKIAKQNKQDKNIRLKPALNELAMANGYSEWLDLKVNVEKVFQVKLQRSRKKPQ